MTTPTSNPHPHLSSLLVNLTSCSLLSSTLTTGIYIGNLVPLSVHRDIHLLASLPNQPPLTPELAVLQALCRRKDGRALVNLCCCLGCGFEEGFAVSVLDALADWLEGEFRPEWRVGRGQWGVLLRLCGMVFDERVFRGNVLGVLKRGLTVRKTVEVVVPLGGVKMEMAQVLATVLVEMGRVLHAEGKVVHVTGVDLCGWIAVWAEEVLGLRIEVYNQEGDLVRRSFEEGEGKVQVTVRFVKVQGLSTGTLSVVIEG